MQHLPRGDDLALAFVRKNPSCSSFTEKTWKAELNALCSVPMGQRWILNFGLTRPSPASEFLSLVPKVSAKSAQMDSIILGVCSCFCLAQEMLLPPWERFPKGLLPLQCWVGIYVTSKALIKCSPRELGIWSLQKEWLVWKGAQSMNAAKVSCVYNMYLTEVWNIDFLWPG